MQSKKILFLFLALLLPICIFIFLKIFGKNEFHVKPLYQEALPETKMDCLPVTIPYKLSAEVVRPILKPGDSLGLLYFKSAMPSMVSQNQLARIEKEFIKAPLTISIAETNAETEQSKKCVFFLNEPYDLVLVDKRGLIRGQYISNDREEVDRLITEIDIILKNY